MKEMAMTLQGSVLSNGNAATNRNAPLKLEQGNKVAENEVIYLDDASNSSSHNFENGDGGAKSVDPKVEKPQEASVDVEEPVIDITINNVVCSFSVKSHLNLKDIAQRGCNVEYRRENGMVTMKIRKPYTTASIWSSGKVTCTGATSEEFAKVAARRVARSLSKLGYPKIRRLYNYRVVNVLGTCTMPFAILITPFSAKHREASYEPELHPGVTYRLKEPKATLKIFSTGSITVTAPCVSNIQSAIEHIYPLVDEFRKERSPEDLHKMKMNKRLRGLKRNKEMAGLDDEEALLVDEELEEEEEDDDSLAIIDEDFDSDKSHD